jgi:hypothetical protein
MSGLDASSAGSSVAMQPSATVRRYCTRDAGELQGGRGVAGLERANNAPAARAAWHSAAAVLTRV